MSNSSGNYLFNSSNSNDNHIFYIERNVAEQSDYVKKQIHGMKFLLILF